jgi:hypothetical protein
MIIDETGSVVTAATDILSTQAWLGGVSVATLQNDTYLLAYAHGTGEPPDQTYEYNIFTLSSSDFISWS